MECLQEIRRRKLPLRVLVLTMHSEQQYIREVMLRGADGYLRKDTLDTELFRALRTVAAGKRYIAGIANGAFYLLGALFAGSIVTLFAALPPAFVAALAGLALIGAITSNVVAAMGQPEHRESAIVCFLATASGMTFLGQGSAFWGIVIGSLAHAVLSWRKAARTTAPASAS